MRVKRRTVWLLTLFSLAAVISVYYVTDNSTKPFDGLAFFGDNLTDVSISGLGDGADENKETVTSKSHMFEEMRMEISNERSQLQEQLSQKIASNEYTAEEKNQAYTEYQQLTKQTSGEAMLEMLIRSLGYSDALVRTEGSKVSVTVVSDELSIENANNIVYLVRTEWAEAQDVSVKMQGDSY